MVLLTTIGCKNGPSEKPAPSAPTLSESSAYIDFHHQEATFTVTSPTDWTISTQDEWITYDIEGGEANVATDVVLEIAENHTGAPRVGNVDISAPGLKTVTFIVNQEEGDPADYKYTITVSYSSGGTASADVESAKVGETVTLTADPDPGHMVIEWSVISGRASIADQGSNTATFKMPSEDITIMAEFGHYPPTDFSNKLSGVNREIYSIMRDAYYWNDAVRTASSVPANNLSPSQFLSGLIEGLRWEDVQDTSNGENPATIDGQWNEARTGRDHIYSYIQQIGGVTRAASSEVSFGLGYEPLREEFSTDITDGGQIRYFFIAWIQPGGPAEAAGLKRGTVIAKYNGQTIGYNQYAQFHNMLYGSSQGSTMTLTDTKGNTYSLTSKTMKTSPTIVQKMLTSSTGKKVGYLAYTSFEPGRRSEFDQELRNNVFGSTLRGAEELVLDLRYNGGGAVSSCQTLSSLVADVDRTDIFCKMWYNAHTAAVMTGGENPQVLPFNDEPNSLRLRRVYVLGTKSTASASEMVISAIRGVDTEVILIGEETNGKNVGMDACGFQSGGAYYDFRPITFKIMNAKDFCDYAGGFQPDYRINELRGMNPVDGSGIRELGDPEENLLKAALAHIDGGTPDVDNTTRASERSGYSFPGKLDPPAQGLMGNSYELRDGKWERTTMQ